MKAQFKTGLLALASLLFSVFNFGSRVTAQSPAGIKNIVIVHGAFCDRSGWQSVYKVLTGKGYQVTLVQIPLTSLQEDVAVVGGLPA